MRTTNEDTGATTVDVIKALVKLFVAAVVAYLSYLLLLVIQHRRRYKRENDLSVKSGTGAQFTSGRANTSPPPQKTPTFWSGGKATTEPRGAITSLIDLQPGDLIFTRQKPLDSQWERFVNNPKDVALGVIAALPMQPHHPTHVALVLSDCGGQTGAAAFSQIELLNINSSSTDVCVTTLDKFLVHHQRAHFDVHVATINRKLHPSVIANLKRSLQQTKPAYGTSLIVTSMLPRSEEQYIVSPDDVHHSTEPFMFTPRVDGVTSLSVQEQYMSEAYMLPAYNKHWKGIGSKSQTCASIVYAAYELAGLVVAFAPQSYHESVNSVKYGKLFTKELVPASYNRRRLIEPHAMMPADFLRRDFQWTKDVGVVEYVSLWTLLPPRTK